ncbi:MAG: hypothetical protein U0575_10105 [Phycisphaerales bacterium]
MSFAATPHSKSSNDERVGAPNDPPHEPQHGPPGDHGSRTEAQAPTGVAASPVGDPRALATESLAPGIRAGLLAAALYLVAAPLYWLAASAMWSRGLQAGVVVSDAISWHRNFALVTPERPMVMARPGFIFFALYRLSPHANSVANLLMLASAIVLTATAVHAAVLARRRDDGSIDAAPSPAIPQRGAADAARRAALLCGMLLALTPWTWVLTLGPTKEPFALLAAAGTTLFCVRPRIGTAVLAIATLAVLALVRVEQTIMFLAVMVMTPLLRRVAQPRLLLAIVACVGIAVGVHLFAVGEGLLGDRFFSLSPQLWPVKDTLVDGPEATVGEIGRRLSELGWYDPAWNAVALGYRLIANLAGALLRMGVVTVDGLPSVLGIGQALAGFVTVAGFVAVAVRLRRPTDRENLALAAQMLVIWIGASMVAFVQPRYVFVEVPAALAALSAAPSLARRRVLVSCLAVALACRAIFALAGRGIPVDQHRPGPHPPFLLQFQDGDAPPDDTAPAVGAARPTIAAEASPATVLAVDRGAVPRASRQPADRNG